MESKNVFWVYSTIAISIRRSIVSGCLLSALAVTASVSQILAPYKYTYSFEIRTCILGITQEL